MLSQRPFYVVAGMRLKADIWLEIMWRIENRTLLKLSTSLPGFRRSIPERRISLRDNSK